VGFYARHLGPRLVRCLCAADDIRHEREKVVPLATGTVLEIGIGPGLNLSLYHPARVELVIGVDPNESFLRLGREARCRCPVPLEVICAPAESLPLAPESIDTAVVTYTLCSVDDPDRTLGEIRRVLKPDGRILFLEHGLSRDPEVARWQRRLNPVWRAVAVGCNLDRPVQALLRRSGFRVEEVEETYMPGAPRPVGYQSRGIARAA
jgi:SAM-dependent methyltransferase